MKWLITGGAGFIGSNTADRLLQNESRVIMVDNLSRMGAESNLSWLRERHGTFPFWAVDVRDYEELKQVLRRHQDVDVILHLAAQVAVTASVISPREDFEINALGTLNLLEAVRELGLDPVILFVSTNKVYGAMEHLAVVDDGQRYHYRDFPECISESVPLDFHSPYGCSKGCADQYVRDYYRIYGVRTIVFRNSCIYGPRQFGVEDQGWLAWFTIAAVLGLPIIIYGDGKQVRDVLYIDDLVEALLQAVRHIQVTQGQVYNIGGGPDNTVAIWREFGPMLKQLLGKPIEVTYDDWRLGDQRVYVSDISKARRDFGWQPEIGLHEGVQSLFDWVSANQHLFNSSSG